MSDTTRNQAAAIAAYSVCRDDVLRLMAWPSCLKRQSMLGWHDQATPWTLSHRYEVGDRCTNDTAKTYECTTAGTSAASGGPTGTTDDITDGTVVWDYKEASTTANNWCWVALTAYLVGDVVSNDTGKVYRCITAGTSAASGGPTGTTTDITDGTAHWCYYGTPPANRTSYDYLWIRPIDCLRIVKVPIDGAASEDVQGIAYKREGLWIYTNQDPSVLLYVRQETDPTMWDELLQTTVAMRIVADICLYVTGDAERAEKAEQTFGSWYATARPVAMEEATESPTEPTPWDQV
jgi:hypothetical protein